MSNARLLRQRQKLTDQLVENLMSEWPPFRNGYVRAVPSKHHEAIADALTTIVAEAVASYLDAGSEREAVMEDLGPHITAELEGWTEQHALGE